MKRLKTSIRSSLGQTRIIRIKLHCPSLSEFDPTAAIDMWFKKCTRRMSEQNRKPNKSQKELGKKSKSTHRRTIKCREKLSIYPL